MLRARLEIVPFGDESRAHEIGQLLIFNKGPSEFGHHEYGVIDPSSKEPGMFTKTIQHRRDRGAWRLLYKALSELDVEGP